MQTARKKATYEDLYSIPENMTGEIIDGELIVSPHPAPKHSSASSGLGSEISMSYRFGKGGGPGGWVILAEVEVLFGENLLVPDISGWLKTRLPTLPETNWIAVVPDWVCEVLSPSTARLDRVKKMHIFAQFGVPYVWLVDPIAKMLEIFKLESGKWLLLSTFMEDDKVRAKPFDEIEIDLSLLWS